MRIQVPIAITFVVGMLIILDFFFPIPGLATWSKEIQSWGIIVAAFALGLAAVNLLRIHVRKVTDRKDEWYNSAALIVALVVQTFIGLTQGVNSTSYQFGFKYIQTPLGATIFALLAFYIASAGYRAFIAKSIDASILLVVAVIVMLGRAPVGEFIWSAFPKITNWIMDFPNMAGQRGIIIGSALGAIALGIRVLLGIERGHLGGSE
ncbi:MAG: hypothetical protein ACM3ZQ_02215 [Bacillota bacterium]